jgi:hypothetical protein
MTVTETMADNRDWRLSAVHRPWKRRFEIDCEWERA